LLGKLAKAALSGDGALLGALVESFEAEGFLVVGAEEVLGNATPEAGAMGKFAPHGDDFIDIVKAVNVVRAIGPYDIGQGAVVASGQVLAIEAVEGTDLMLERCVGLQARLSIATPGGVLVKIPKPGHELRVDLPTVGPETLHGVRRAGLRGIALVAGEAIIMEREAMHKLADQLELYVYGFTWAELEERAVSTHASALNT